MTSTTEIETPEQRVERHKQFVKEGQERVRRTGRFVKQIDGNGVFGPIHVQVLSATFIRIETTGASLHYRKRYYSYMAYFKLVDGEWQTDRSVRCNRADGDEATVTTKNRIHALVRETCLPGLTADRMALAGVKATTVAFLTAEARLLTAAEEAAKTLAEASEEYTAALAAVQTAASVAKATEGVTYDDVVWVKNNPYNH